MSVLTLYGHRRLNSVKGCLIVLFISNMYFSLRYVELSNIVRRLEVQREDCENLLHATQNFTKSMEKEQVQLYYSQRKYYPYILNEAHKCKDESLQPLPVFLLIVVKSTVSQFPRRKAIRRTWGNESNIDGIVIKRIFLLARGSNEFTQTLLHQESEKFHDIIQGDFHDSFRNLTIKDIMFMRWMTAYCPQVKFIFKGDDDVFVNIHNIVDYLVALSPREAKNLFAGSVLFPSPRIVNPSSKYYVSSNLWNEKYYPPYVSGGGFVMSSLVSKKIFEVTKVIPIIPIDDAFLGVCLKKLKIKPSNHRGFKSWGIKKGPKDLCAYNEVMTFHKVSSEEMDQVWLKLHDPNANFSDCSTHFKVVKDKHNKITVI